MSLFVKILKRWVKRSAIVIVIYIIFDFFYDIYDVNLVKVGAVVHPILVERVVDAGIDGSNFPFSDPAYYFILRGMEGLFHLRPDSLSGGVGIDSSDYSMRLINDLPISKADKEMFFHSEDLVWYRGDVKIDGTDCRWSPCARIWIEARDVGRVFIYVISF